LGDLPRTEQLAAEVLSLPVYPELTREQLNWVILSVGAFFAGEDYRYPPDLVPLEVRRVLARQGADRTRPGGRSREKVERRRVRA
jgi:hypothetical protein